MNSSRWAKLCGDLRAHRGRVAMMAAAICLGVIGVGAMLTARAILVREITRSYAETRPAHATFEVDAADAALAESLSRQPGVAAAVPHASVLARVRVGADWLPLLLFVVDDFQDQKLNRFTAQAGAWPPPEGTLLLERSAVAMLGTAVGAELPVKPPHGATRTMVVSGLVHDAGLAPAWQERTGYGYITRATLARLGEPPVWDELRVRLADDTLDRPALEAEMQRLAGWLETQGRTVREIQIPPPRRHPHQGQMQGVLAMFTVFSALAFALASVLVATVVAGIMAGQVREIGVMKAVGARTGQVALIYLALVAGVCLVALAIGLPLAMLIGRKFAGMIAVMLNFDLASLAVPAWVLGVQIVSGLALPLGFAAWPIRRASRGTVRAALSDHGVRAETFGRDRLDRALSAWEGPSRLRLLALRNLLRRRGRLLLSLGLLTASGAMFLTAINVRDMWQAMVARVYTDRHYDTEVRLNRPEPAAALVAALREVPGVRVVEPWGFSATAFATPGRHDTSTTYPDGGHGSFTLLGAPATTRLISFPLLSGRWLRPDDDHGVVLNHMVWSQKPEVKVGDRISLSLHGRPTEWRVVGIVEEVGAPGAAYVTSTAYARETGTADRTEMLRIATDAPDAAARLDLIRRIESALAKTGASVRMALPLSELRTAIGDHVAVLVGTLVVTAALFGAIGLLGLSSTMRMNILERTREFGVMKAVGARPGTIMGLVVAEGMAVGALGWLCSLPAASALSWAMGRYIGLMSFRLPLPLVTSHGAIAVWLVAVLGLSALASAWPARQAGRLTVRETLAYG